jgi:hypothetical protein
MDERNESKCWYQVQDDCFHIYKGLLGLAQNWNSQALVALEVPP